MAQLAHVALSASVDCRRTFTVARNRRGYWIARDLDGMIEGVFVGERRFTSLSSRPMGGARR